MDWFDLMSSEHFHVILSSDKKHGLIYNRLDDSVSTINYDDAKELTNLKKINRIYGIVGKYLNRYLVLIKNRSFVGTLYDPNSKKEHDIYVITQVQVLDINSSQYIPTTITNQPGGNDNSTINTTTTKISSETSDHLKTNNTVRYDATKENESTNFKLPKESQQTTSDNCPNTSNDCNEQDFSSLPITISTSSYNSHARSMAWNPFKLANSIKTKMPTQLLKSAGFDSNTTPTNNNINISNQQVSSLINQSSVDDANRRLIDEMIKLFNNTNSFYFSPTLDLTNRFSQTKNSIKIKEGSTAIWKTANERFFWNKYMLKDLIELSLKDGDANHFICVILQGFIAIENHIVNASRGRMSNLNESGVENVLHTTSMNSIKKSDLASSNSSDNNIENNGEKNYKLALVSRRSVFQAGTRYRRRGCDDQGNCANFVETEQIFIYKRHFTSLVILRGSIPLYWYQTGYNYRPPPVMYKNDEENHKAFEKHFKNLIYNYENDQIICIDCTEQTGREKELHDAYRAHIDRLRFDYKNVKLIEFDFHKHCRGRQCSDSQVEKHLKSCGLSEQLIDNVKYYWNDGDIIWSQNGVFRVNCLDCSDRTNVVQRAIALKILDIQLARLGVIAPDTCPEDNDCRRIMQILWSTNGNVLSTQYCGTRALFTSDRKFSGYLKDTYSSASRYYISKFRDAYRQAAIDAMLGVVPDENNLRLRDQKDPSGSNITDHFELINLDSIYIGKSGGALLKDVGNRMSNRLARLKGRFYMKSPFNLDTMGMSRVESASEAYNETDLIEGRISKTLDGLNIDWPSSESITAATIPPPDNRDHDDEDDNCEISPKRINVFSQLSNSDDNFQDDDEFGQLMLSIDLAELQKLRDGGQDIDNSDEQKGSETVEEIHMTETKGLNTKVGYSRHINKSKDTLKTSSNTSTTST